LATSAAVGTFETRGDQSCLYDETNLQDTFVSFL